MITEHFSYLSYDGHTQIHAVKWLPDNGSYTHILQITHGMLEHILRYQEFAHYLTDQGFLVVGQDHLGHGQTAGSPSDFGYFAPHAPSETLIRDMHTLYLKIHQENPGIPYFMLGHSMGSYLLRKYLSCYQDSLTGAIILGTGYVPPLTTAIAILCTRIIALCKGWRHHSDFVKAVTFGNSYKLFDMTGEHPENSWLTRDTAIVNQILQDPLGKFTFTLNGYYGLFQTVLFDCQLRNVKKTNPDLPLLFASGDCDPVGDLGKGFLKAVRLYQKAGVKKLDVKLYEGARHELVHELNRQTVYQHLLDWMIHGTAPV